MDGRVEGQVLLSRTYEYAPSSFDRKSALTMSGLDYMRALASGQMGAPPSINSTIGMSSPFDLVHGQATIEADPSDFLLNPIGTVHGGFAATLLDSVMALAVHTTLPAGIGYTTAELKINYTRMILPTTGRLRAQGSIIHQGRQMATAEGRLIGVGDGKLYAHGTTTCFLYSLA